MILSKGAICPLHTRLLFASVAAGIGNYQFTPFLVISFLILLSVNFLFFSEMLPCIYHLLFFYAVVLFCIYWDASNDHADKV